MLGKIAQYPSIIKEAHLDTFGHVNNAAYLTLLEEARWELITQNGYGLAVVQTTGQGPTLLEIKLTFLKELRLRDAIIIETQLTDYQHKIGTLAQTIRRNGVVCCTAEMSFGLFDMTKRKLLLPTPAWLKAIGYE